MDLARYDRAIRVLESPFKGYRVDDADPTDEWWYPNRWEINLCDKLILDADDSEAGRNRLWYIWVFTTLVYLLFAFFICFIRPDLLDMTIVGVAITMYICCRFRTPNVFKHKYARFIFFWTVISIFADIIWLIINWNPWNTDLNQNGKEIGVRNFSKWMSIFLLVIKVSSFLTYRSG